LVPTPPTRPEPTATHPDAAAARPEPVVAVRPVVPARAEPVDGRVKVVESSSEPDGLEGATLMLPTAALVMVDASGSRKEFPLSVFNEIGRAEENRIHVPNPGISRKHALIKASSGGFVISDLGSQNGTFVNGERISERRLANGDAIDLGSVKFVFHTPWPSR
jgi:pSer/pThr/pTyr-binding forkhead associated (FHA) protein